MQSIVASSAATIEASFTNQHGDATVPTGEVGVVVTSFDGTEIASGTATVAGITCSFNLAAALTAQLDWLIATWVDEDLRTITSSIEIVGAVYASLDLIRASDPTLTQKTKYPDDKVRQRRAEVESEFEGVKATRVAWVPRFAFERLDWVRGCDTIHLRPQLRRVRSIRVFTSPTDYTDIDPAIVATIPPDPDGQVDLHRLGIAWGYRIEIAYEHGHDQPTADLLDAFMVRLRDRLNTQSSGLPARATSMTTGDGSPITLAVPGRPDSVTGIPSVDKAIEAHQYVRALVA